MRKIYLIRHAKTKANVEMRYCGSTESPIVTPVEEIRQTILRKISLQEMGRIYCSPRQRALDTAMAVTDEMIIEEGFREIDFGIFENLTIEEIMKRHPMEFDKWANSLDDFQFPKGNRGSDFFVRVTQAFERVCKETPPDSNITIFTHGGVIQSLISYLLTKNNSLFWNFRIENCGVTGIRMDCEIITFEKINY